MGTYIEAACVQAGNRTRRATARRLANDAARACFSRAGCSPSDVDMLINVGVYREDSMGEPALAALIQEDIGANLGHPPTGGSGSFSFDLLNGACGVITAVQIESGLLHSGVIQLGAVVSSDVQPELENPGAHFLRPAGGAMLLRWDDRLAGFTDFCTQTFPEYEDLFTSGLVWQERHGIRAPRQGNGHHRMAVSVKPGYQGRLVDCAEEATRFFLARAGLDIEDIDLLVPSPSRAGFVDPLRARLGIPGDRVAYTPEDLEGVYTTGPIAALQGAIKSGRLGEAHNALLLAAGAGITVALALYRQTPPGG
ncbi:MAG TPA: 3-oxoacyl-[acyl-carrier-protein] synthase III C-terminal domain-containing protein [Streptosporangiaceae bacterium]|nr:3-oxoacyl-[acyl-carrier-protein] synthase III C-terminal domain-containing protein [Streptosporangiaceae bacterium]